VTLCLKRVMVGNHLFKELVDCHFRFSDGRKSGSRGAILKVLSDMRFGPECNGLSLAWPSLLCHRQSGSNSENACEVSFTVSCRLGKDAGLNLPRSPRFPGTAGTTYLSNRLNGHVESPYNGD
jgi:hypothetical protein